MEVEFQDQGQLDQYLEEWLYPRGSQSNCGIFYEQEKQEYIWIGYLAIKGAIIRHQAPEGGASTLVVVKCLVKVEGYGSTIYAPLCNGLYKEEENSVVLWS